MWVFEVRQFNNDMSYVTVDTATLRYAVVDLILLDSRPGVVEQVEKVWRIP